MEEDDLVAQYAAEAKAATAKSIQQAQPPDARAAAVTVAFAAAVATEQSIVAVVVSRIVTMGAPRELY